MTIKNCIFGLLIFALIIENQVVFAQQNKSTSLKIDPAKIIFIDFNFAPFNKNPDAAEEAILYFKDTVSGKLTKITLQEKNNNSPIFEGQFVIGWSENGELQAEIYLPPQKTAKSSGGSVVKMIQDGTIPRKPYFLRSENGKQKLTIFNNADQAIAAYDQYRKMTAITVPTVATPSIGQNVNPLANNKPLVDPSVLEAQKKVELEKARELEIQKVKEQELLRKQLEEAEKIRQEEMKKQQEALLESEKQKRKDDAKLLAVEALKLYQLQKFIEAEEKFKNSIELDPSNTTYLYQYGVTLYKNEKFNEAIIQIKMSLDEEKIHPTSALYEKTFYKGLCHMKLKEYDHAAVDFITVSNSEDKTIGPSATFFAGIILFTQQKWEDSKKYFEKTLDISDDPKMSDQADSYIEQIINILQFEEKKKKRFTLDLGSGLTYDSNVLSISNSTASASALNKAGLRGLLSVGGEYRIAINELFENSFQIAYTDMYTTTTGFKGDANLQKADPLMLQYKLPFKFKGKLFSKAYQITLTPGYDSLNLNINESSTREKILTSSYLATDQTFIIDANYITTVGIEFRQDTSLVPDDSASNAAKMTLTNSNVFFQDAKKTRALLFNWGFASNNAKGDEKKYTKVDLSAGYLMPHLEKNTLTTLLALTSSNYAKSAAGRKDSGYTITTSYSKPFADNLKGAASLSYNSNNSTVETSKYDKLSIATTISWTGDF